MMSSITLWLVLFSLIANAFCDTDHGKPKLRLLSPAISDSQIQTYLHYRGLDIPSNVTVHFRCEGDRPLIWRYPSEIEVSKASLPAFLRIFLSKNDKLTTLWANLALLDFPSGIVVDVVTSFMVIGVCAFK